MPPERPAPIEATGLRQRPPAGRCRVQPRADPSGPDQSGLSRPHPAQGKDPAGPPSRDHRRRSPGTGSGQDATGRRAPARNGQSRRIKGGRRSVRSAARQVPGRDGRPAEADAHETPWTPASLLRLQPPRHRQASKPGLATAGARLRTGRRHGDRRPSRDAGRQARHPAGHRGGKIHRRDPQGPGPRRIPSQERHVDHIGRHRIGRGGRRTPPHPLRPERAGPVARSGARGYRSRTARSGGAVHLSTSRRRNEDRRRRETAGARSSSAPFAMRTAGRQC